MFPPPIFKATFASGYTPTFFSVLSNILIWCDVKFIDLFDNIPNEFCILVFFASVGLIFKSVIGVPAVELETVAVVKFWFPFPTAPMSTAKFPTVVLALLLGIL